MAKAKEEVTTEVKETTTKEVSVKEMIESLEIQYAEYLKNIELNKTMALKAQGALEILKQIKE